MRLFILALVLAVSASCSRQAAVTSPNVGPTSGPQLPFDRVLEKHGISPTQALASTAIPIGSRLVVRLQSSISSANSQPGDAFSAVLDEPILINGETLAARGAEIMGKVAAAKAARQQDVGYLRLTLSSIAISGKTVEIHTSSVFAKNSSHMRRKALMNVPAADEQGRLVRTDEAARNAWHVSKNVKFSTDRRLTFHLVEPLPLEIQGAPEMALQR